jgi:hypothetical protein
MVRDEPAPNHLCASQVRRSWASGGIQPPSRQLLGFGGINVNRKGAEAIPIVSIDTRLAVTMNCGGFKAVRIGFQEARARQGLQYRTHHSKGS